MRFITLLAAMVGLAATASAHADACRDEIAALYDGGALDSATRPAHRQTKDVFAPDGTRLYTFDIKVASATETVAGVRDSGSFVMVIGNKTWLGPSIDGPWTPSADMIGDPAAAQAQVVDSQQANLSDTECPGLTERDGKTYRTYTFRTQVDPSPERGNSWFGSLDTIYLDPDSGQVMIWEQTEHIASWSPDMNMERHVIVFDYDASITVTPE